jgi:hypothetical protein
MSKPVTFFAVYWPKLSLLLIILLILSFIYAPAISSWVGVVLLLGTLIAALGASYQKHTRSQISGVRVTLNILLDILGLLFVIFIASYLGGLAGTWASQYGLYLGLAAGVLAGFLSAWGVRKVWGKLNFVT